MESGPSSPSILLDRYAEFLAENLVGFSEFMEEVLAQINEDSFENMTAKSYNKKKCYMRLHLLELLYIHNTLAEQFSDLIEEVRKKCPHAIQNQHHESSDSGSPLRMLAPKLSTIIDYSALWRHRGSGSNISKGKGLAHSDSDSESSMSAVSKLPAPPYNVDAMKVEETEGSGSESTVKKPPVNDGAEPSMPCASKPPINYDDLKVEEAKDSGPEDYSMLTVNKPPDIPVNDDALKVQEIKDFGSEESSMSTVKKAAVSDDALKVEKTKDSGSRDSSMSTVKKTKANDNALKLDGTKDSGSGDSSMSTVKRTEVNDEALKVEETKESDSEDSSMSTVKKAEVNDDALKLEGTKDSGSGDSSMSTVKKTAVSDDGLKVKEINEPEVLVEKVSILEESVTSLKQQVEDLTDENVKLKQEIEENVADVNLYMSESRLETKAMEEELKASKDKAKKVDEEMSALLVENITNKAKHENQMQDMNMRMTRYRTEISELKTTHERKEKIWNDVTGQLKQQLDEKTELIDELKQNVRRKDEQLDVLWAEKRSQDLLIEQLQARLKAVQFENVRKLTDEVKVKVGELEREVQMQKEARQDKN